MYLFLCQHLLVTSDLMFNTLSSLCRAITRFSLRHKRHALELWTRKSFVFDKLFKQHDYFQSVVDLSWSLFTEPGTLL